MSSEIPFIKPSFPKPSELAEDFADIVESNWFTNFGPKEQQLAKALEHYLGQDLRVTTVANGTLALLAAVECTFGHGDHSRYLLMPSFTFAAVPQSAIWCGWRPWFIDIDPGTWQCSVESARAVLEKSRDQIAGILLANAIGVGNPAIGEWESLASEWDLEIVIDSAAGFGSRYSDGQLLGGRGACEIFSFHATKPYAIGEGGAVVSRDPDLIKRAYDFQNFGFNASREATMLGINGKLAELGAAIGLRQLVGLDDRLASRLVTFDRYRSELSGAGLRFHTNAELSSLWCATVCCSSVEHKARVLASLRQHSVQVREYYNPPMHLHQYFTANSDICASGDLSVTEKIALEIVSLPIHDNMNPDDISRIIAAVVEAS